MKSLIPAVLVVILEAGFLASIAALPDVPSHVAPQVDVARAGAVRAQPAPHAAVRRS